MEDNKDERLDKILDNVSKMDGISDETIQAVEALNAALKAEANSQEKMSLGSAIRVNPLTDLQAKYLTEASVAGMSIKQDQLNGVMPDGKVSECIFLATLVKTTDLDTGAQVICGAINKLSAKGLLVGALAPLSSVELVKVAGRHPTSAVIAYVHVPEEKVEEVNLIAEYSIKEESETRVTGKLEIDLPPGEFFAFERLTIAANMILGHPGREAMLEETIKQYLGVLPKGTEFLGAVECGIDSLCVPYELKFKHPILHQVREVKLNYVRGAGADGDNFVQGNILLGVQYIGKDGKELFK